MRHSARHLSCQAAAKLLGVMALAIAHPGYTTPITQAQANINESRSTQPNTEGMIREAERLRTEGKYSDAEAIWTKLLDMAQKSLGPEHPAVATIFNNLAELLKQQGKYAAADSLIRRSLAIYSKAHGPTHRYVAASLNNLADLLRSQGQLSAAEPLYRRSLAIYEQALGPDHPDVATVLNNLAVLLSRRGQSAKVEPLYRRALSITEKNLGANHPDVALRLNNLAALLGDQGQYSAADSLYRRALAIYEKALGPDHPDIAVSLNNLASLLKTQGYYSAAEPLYRRSLSIRENKLGKDHPSVASSLNNLAGLLEKQGKYSAAEILYRRSLSIGEKQLREDHPDVASILNNLASLLKTQGLYSAAEPLYRRSLSITEKNLGPDHTDVANSLNNLAELLRIQGQLSTAESLYRRSLAIYEQALGPEHPDVATSLNNLAALLSSRGKPAEAEPLYRRALSITEKNLGANHPDVALILNNLAALLGDLGQYSAADSLYRRALAIHEKSLGPKHPGVALSLNNLALLLSEQGNYSSAQKLLTRSAAIEEKVHGTDHPTLAMSLTNLASVLIARGNSENAISTLKRSLEMQSSWLYRELPLLPDQSRSLQLRQLGDSWQLPFGLIQNHTDAIQLALETRLNRQGLLQEIEERQALLLKAPGIDRSKVEQLQALTQQLASVSLPAGRMAGLRDQRDKLQAEIFRQIPELQLQIVTLSEVARALPADGALVEFQRYRPFDSRKPKDQRWSEAQYIALVLKPDASVASVPLGQATAIDSKVHQGLRAIADGLSDADAIWSELTAHVFKPLMPHLTASRQWFLSPDGELNRVPFSALPAPQEPDTTLAKAIQLRLLTTGRELVKLQEPSPTGSASLVMANPAYDRLGGKPAEASKGTNVTTVALQRSAELGSSQWKQLPASEREGQKVAKLLGTGLISGSSATTTALQRHQGPRVLHVATHGFFVADQETKPTGPIRAIQEGSPLLRSLRQEDPQLRSGLVFAGANQPDVDPKDDGYLTAAEALNLNLKGTELVVLSACSTGQGDVRTGEGVYGLQRSLTVAGARSTLLSLWKVDDAATAEFMVRYYQRLKAGEGRSDALAAVQEEFRSGKVQSGTGADWKEPYYWAAWQLVGDWRPIKGL